MDSGVNEGSVAKLLDLRNEHVIRVSRTMNLPLHVSRAGKFLLFLIAYAVAYKYSLVFSEHAPAPLWFPDSVLLCALLLLPKKQWAVYMLGALPIRLMNTNVPTWFLGATYLNDCLKAILSAYFLRRYIPGSVRLNTLRQFGIYIATAVLGMPILSALAGAAARLSFGDNYWRAFYQWFLGDVAAALVLTPTLLYWCLDGWKELKQQAFSFTALMFGVAALLYFIFVLSHSNYSPLLLYVPVPLLILAATKFRPLGVSTALSLLALVSIVSAVQGRGVFGTVQSAHSVLSMQLFLFVISVPMLFVAIIIEERQVVQDELSASQTVLGENYQRIRDLAGRLLNAQENERRKIARELHDDIGQRLALLCVNLDILANDLPEELKDERIESRKLLNDLKELATDVHNVSHQLHSSGVEHLGLQRALNNLCDSVGQQHRIRVEFRSDRIEPVSQEVALCIFRVAQEALNNAIKHGRPERIDIILALQNGLLRMTVKDNGAGFDTKTHTNGLGLVSMQERVRYVGGKLELKSQLGEGTEVHASMPT